MGRMMTDDKPCLYNLGVSAVECVGMPCATCGWNPSENKRRKQLLRWREEARMLTHGPLIVKGRKSK